MGDAAVTAKRVDSNQAEIVAALRAVGAAVQSLASIGHGCPDVLCFFRRQLFLLEVKSPRGRLTAEEAAWHEAWPGAVYVVRSVDEALDAIGAVRYSAEEMLPPRRAVRVVGREP